MQSIRFFKMFVFKSNTSVGNITWMRHVIFMLKFANWTCVQFETDPDYSTYIMQMSFGRGRTQQKHFLAYAKHSSAAGGWNQSHPNWFF